MTPPCLDSTWEGRSRVSPPELRVCSDSQCFWDRGAWGAPPPLLAALQEAELSLGLAVGGGAEGSVSPHPPPPSSGFRLETDCAASSSHHRHRPSHHHCSSLFSWAWPSLPTKIPSYPPVLSPGLGAEGRLGQDFKSHLKAVTQMSFLEWPF